MDNLAQRFPVAIAVNHKYHSLISNHPSIKAKTAAINKLDPTALKMIILDKMDDGCLPLYSNEDVKLAIAANQSYDRQMGISFIDWLNLCSKNKDLK